MKDLLRTIWDHALFPLYVLWAPFLVLGYIHLPPYWTFYMLLCAWLLMPYSGMCGQMNRCSLLEMRISNCVLEIEILRRK